MEYKYEKVESVEAKTDFEVYKHDEDGEVIDTLVIPKGTKGVIESMGWSSTDGFKPHYGILFKTDETEIEVGLYEDKTEEFLILN